MTKDNEQRKFRRRTTNEVNEGKSKKDALIERMSNNDKYLLNKINDQRDGVASLVATNSESIARINRETNEFYKDVYNPAMTNLLGQIQAEREKVEVLTDLVTFLLFEPDRRDIELTPEQIVTLGLEDELEAMVEDKSKENGETDPVGTVVAET